MGRHEAPSTTDRPRAARSFVSRAKSFTAAQLSTAFGIGHIPWAPGTFGSIPGVLLGALLSWATGSLEGRFAGVEAATLWISLVLLAAVGVSLWAIGRTEFDWQTHDDSRIVVDEIVGGAIAVAYVPATPATILAGFLLFRLFDIWKPWAIGWIDRNAPGAWGTLFDDVIAGVVAALILKGAVVVFS